MSDLSERSREFSGVYTVPDAANQLLQESSTPIDAPTTAEASFLVGEPEVTSEVKDVRTPSQIRRLSQVAAAAGRLLYNPVSPSRGSATPTSSRNPFQPRRPSRLSQGSFSHSPPQPPPSPPVNSPYAVHRSTSSTDATILAIHAQAGLSPASSRAGSQIQGSSETVQPPTLFGGGSQRGSMNEPAVPKTSSLLFGGGSKRSSMQSMLLGGGSTARSSTLQGGHHGPQSPTNSLADPAGVGARQAAGRAGTDPLKYRVSWDEEDPVSRPPITSDERSRQGGQAAHHARSPANTGRSWAPDDGAFKKVPVPTGVPLVDDWQEHLQPSSPRLRKKAGFWRQTRALMVKNSLIQMRAWRTNVSLLSGAFFFPFILLVLQSIINDMLDTPDNKCGCLCDQCCSRLNTSNCFTNVNPVLDVCPSGYLCQKPVDKAEERALCGLKYSNQRQAPFCGIVHPSVWPALWWVPSASLRSSTYSPAVALLYTGSNRTMSQALTSAMLPYPQYSQVPRQLQAQLALQAGAQMQSFRGDSLSTLGYTLGSSVFLDRGLFLDQAFDSGPAAQPLNVLLPDCQADNGAAVAFLASIFSQLRAGASSNASAQFVSAVALAGGQLPPVPQAACSSDSAAQGDSGSCQEGFTAHAPQLRRLQAAHRSADAAPIPQPALNCTTVIPVYAATPFAVNAELYCGFGKGPCEQIGVQQMLGGVDWQNSSVVLLNVSVWFNTTNLPYNPKANIQKPERLNALVNRAVNSWVRWATGLNVEVNLLGVAAFPKVPVPIGGDFSSTLGTIFYVWMFHLLLPVFTRNLVDEKQQRVRLMMKMHGLGDGSYWLISYAWCLLLCIVFFTVLYIFATICRISMFLHTQGLFQAALYFLWSNNLVCTSIFLSALLNSTSVALPVCLVYLFLSGLLGWQLFEYYFPYNPPWIYFIQCVPSMTLYRVMYEITQRAALTTTQAVGPNRFAQNFTNIVFSDLGIVLLLLLLQCVVLLVLGLYIDQVRASSAGVGKHPLFFLPWWLGGPKPPGVRKRLSLQQPQQRTTSLLAGLDPRPGSPRITGFRKRRAGSIVMPTTVVSKPADPMEKAREPGTLLTAAAAIAAGAADVHAERKRVTQMTDMSDMAIVIKGLHKEYPARGGAHGKVAVNDLMLAIRKGECFGLLGPNGAGKTSTLSMLFGLQPPTRGTAYLAGLDLRSQMSDIYNQLGVCPQYDILWPLLTGREHLRFYGRLKGLEGKELESAIDDVLQSVHLQAKGNARVGGYSGGMKRRLSVAISLIGNPAVVVLDEMSTGLDPASRRALWGAIKANKPGRGIIVTTHSMEEAQVLCDRVGVFVSGALTIIGAPKHLVKRYGGYYTLSVCTPAEQSEAAAALVRDAFPSAHCSYALNGTQRFEIPAEAVSLSKLFTDVAQWRRYVDIVDWGISHATLEDVFVRFCQSIGAKGGS